MVYIAMCVAACVAVYARESPERIRAALAIPRGSALRNVSGGRQVTLV